MGIAPILAHAASGEYIWRPSVITLSIGEYPKIMKGGKYLQLKNVLHEGEHGWTQSKMDLPNTWLIESLKMTEDAVTFRNQLGETFLIKSPKINELNFKILNGGEKSDVALEELWKK